MFGGGLDPQPAEVLGITAGEGVDRYLTAFDLIHSGKAENLVFGGGDYEVNGTTTSEGQLLNYWRKRWGLSKAEVHYLNHSNTTRDEALRVGELVQSKSWENIYLVTSAWHMRRAKAVFLKHGVDVHPIGCDLKGTTNKQGERRWKVFPQSENLKTLHQFTHEILGYHYYQLRGWIK